MIWKQVFESRDESCREMCVPTAPESNLTARLLGNLLWVALVVVAMAWTYFMVSDVLNGRA